MSKVKVRVVVKLGKDLAKKELHVINRVRRVEFSEFESSKQPIDPKPKAQTWDEIFILVKDSDNRLLAFARLRNIEVEFMDNSYAIFGIATVASVIKGQGYGGILMEKVKEFIVQSRKTAVGFCDYKTSPFYEKCEFEIIRKGSIRFIPRTLDGELVLDGIVDDVFSLQGEDRLIDKIIRSPKENVFIPGARW